MSWTSWKKKVSILFLLLRVVVLVADYALVVALIRVLDVMDVALAVLEVVKDVLTLVTVVLEIVFPLVLVAALDAIVNVLVHVRAVVRLYVIAVLADVGILAVAIIADLDAVVDVPRVAEDLALLIVMQNPKVIHVVNATAVQDALDVVLDVWESVTDVVMIVAVAKDHVGTNAVASVPAVAPLDVELPVGIAILLVLDALAVDKIAMVHALDALDATLHAVEDVLLLVCQNAQQLAREHVQHRLLAQ